MATNANDLKRGMAIKWKGAPCIVEQLQHVKPGKGPAYIQASLRNLSTGRGLEERFRSSEAIETVNVSNENWDFSYKEQDNFIFMHPETYDNLTLGLDILGSAKDYLIENLRCQIVFIEGRVAGVELPPSVELKVIDSPEGVKGDSATNVMKPATLETGLSIQVPLFIKEGEIIKVDTRTGKYTGRA